MLSWGHKGQKIIRKKNARKEEQIAEWTKYFSFRISLLLFFWLVWVIRGYKKGQEWGFTDAIHSLCPSFPTYKLRQYNLPPEGKLIWVRSLRHRPKPRAGHYLDMSVPQPCLAFRICSCKPGVSWQLCHPGNSSLQDGRQKQKISTGKNQSNAGELLITLWAAEETPSGGP